MDTPQQKVVVCPLCAAAVRYNPEQEDADTAFARCACFHAHMSQAENFVTHANLPASAEVDNTGSTCRLQPASDAY